MEVLHAERLCEVMFEGVVDILAGDLFKGHACSVELQVVVVEAWPRGNNAALWLLASKPVTRFVHINSGAPAHELLQSRSFFQIQKRRVVLKTELFDSLSHIELAADNVLAH